MNLNLTLFYTFSGMLDIYVEFLVFVCVLFFFFFFFCRWCVLWSWRGTNGTTHDDLNDIHDHFKLTSTISVTTNTTTSSTYTRPLQPTTLSSRLDTNQPRTRPTWNGHLSYKATLTTYTTTFFTTSPATTLTPIDNQVNHLHDHLTTCTINHLPTYNSVYVIYINLYTFT